MNDEMGDEFMELQMYEIGITYITLMVWTIYNCELDLFMKKINNVEVGTIKKFVLLWSLRGITCGAANQLFSCTLLKVVLLLSEAVGLWEQITYKVVLSQGDWN